MGLLANNSGSKLENKFTFPLAIAKLFAMLFPMTTANIMDWQNVARFNFTYALTGGAWLEDKSGRREWVSFSIIQRNLGQFWIDRQLRKQGWMTGCWIDVTP
jgi:hypothetical protein